MRSGTASVATKNKNSSSKLPYEMVLLRLSFTSVFQYFDINIIIGSIVVLGCPSRQLATYFGFQFETKIGKTS